MNKVPISQWLSSRTISTSCSLLAKKNFNKFDVKNKRGTRAFKKRQMTDPHPAYPVDHRGTRPVGSEDEYGHFNAVPEMIPQLIVPDLTDCQLKPYVSYRTLKVVQSEFKPEDLFNAVYADKILLDWNNKKLNEDGTTKEPSEIELMDPDTAWAKARKTGSDIF